MGPRAHSSIVCSVKKCRSVAKRMAESSPVCKKRSYDAAFKLKVIEFAEQNTNRSAARKYGVDEKRVREWKKQKDQLGSLNSKKRRLDGGGCKAALPNMEEEFVAWIESLRAQNLRVTHSNVQSKALELDQARGTEEFHASDGCLQKFLKRHSFSLHRRTTVGQRLPHNLITKVVGGGLHHVNKKASSFQELSPVLHQQHGCDASLVGYARRHHDHQMR